MTLTDLPAVPVDYGEDPLPLNKVADLFEEIVIPQKYLASVPDRFVFSIIALLLVLLLIIESNIVPEELNTVPRHVNRQRIGEII